MLTDSTQLAVTVYNCSFASENYLLDAKLFRNNKMHARTCHELYTAHNNCYATLMLSCKDYLSLTKHA